MGRNFNETNTHKRILIAPLDWGLGHATRCISIIQFLLEHSCEVIISADGSVKTLLQNQFPQIQFLTLKGYRVKYGKSRCLTVIKIIFQIPSILMTIFRENRWLKRVINTHRIDAVISDNRFGLFTNRIPCVYMTHQLKIKTGNKITEKLLQKVHYYFINKFTTCWVPDFASGNNVGGELSHPEKNPKHVCYIGCLSRFEKLITDEKYDLLIVISGPEPQRTLFEKILLAQISNINKTVLFVRGLPNEKYCLVATNKNHTIVNHLPANQLSEAIQQSTVVISRSGYTTIMDLIKLKQKAILIPTPGQTEQEYLAEYLTKEKIFFSASQLNFSLEKALLTINDFPFIIPEFDMNLYKKFVENLVHSLN